MKQFGDLFGSAQGSAVDTFLGLPKCDDPASLDADIAILGAPIATPYEAFGTYTADAPQVIRAASREYISPTHHYDFDLGGPLLGDSGAGVADCGDVAADANDKAGNRARITAAVRAILDAHVVPVVIGGDDSVPIPVFQAFEGRGPLTLVQVDAHIDWRDEVEGERYGLSSPMRRASEMPWIERIVQVGARGTGSARPADYEDAIAWGVQFFRAREVHAHGIQPVLDAIPVGANVLITVDVDGMDPSIMPAVIGPAPGGLTYWHVVELLHGIADKAHIAGFDIVEFMPARDVQNFGALTAARLVCNTIGLIARQVKSSPA